ncbi:MAG: sugar ABC transporter ATP-binding protein [Actinobacteria bacterium]|nr:sugar ABC transporter ATP-binding protein [Actinomycetota bacterium]
MTDNNGIVLKMENITKIFPGVIALEDVSIELYKGEVLGILGENGAGKSTLIKILAGNYIKDSGSIYVDGQKFEIKSPSEAMASGIRVIYQELNTLNNLSVAENIFIGEQLVKGPFKIVDWKAMTKKAGEILGSLNVALDPNSVIGDLSISEKQIVEIAKAISKDAKILVMDEPTAALSEEETQSLFKIIATLKSRGVSIIYISHRLKEIFQITDRVVVLRDGKKVESIKTKDTNANELVTLMVGRDIKEMYPKREVPIGNTVMEVKNLTADGFKDISFKLKKGEILGIFGLLGSGRTSLVKALFGANKVKSGEILINGKKVDIKSPKMARDEKIGLVPLDRKVEGLALHLGVKENITLANIEDLGKGFLIKKQLENKKAQMWIEEMGIKTPTMDQEVNSLSGGNQQKVVLAKWLESGSKIIILNEPTRGIDVGAKIEIYKLMQNLCEKGSAVIMISSELPEILSIADRILVMSKGKMTAEYSRKEASEENLLQSACI